MTRYNRLGITVFEKDDTVPEAPSWAKEKGEDTLKYFWIKSGAPYGYTMPLCSINAVELARDCAFYAEEAGEPLTEDEENSLALYLQDEDDTRIYENFYN